MWHNPPPKKKIQWNFLLQVKVQFLCHSLCPHLTSLRLLLSMTLFKENWGLFQVELLASQGLLSVSPSLIVQFQRLLFPTVSVSVGILGNVDANTGLDVQEMFGGKCGEG